MDFLVFVFILTAKRYYLKKKMIKQKGTNIPYI